MQWIRSHLSFANSISLIALFVALGGTSLAAVTLTKNSVGAKQIKKNAVAASEIKRNAVGASELRSNAVASGDIADNGVGGADLSDNSVGAGELSDNSVGAGELADNSAGSGEIINGSLQVADLTDAAVGPTAFARVQANGQLAVNSGPGTPATGPAMQKGVTNAMINKMATGQYCFDLPFEPRNAVVTIDNRDQATTSYQIVSVSTTRGTPLTLCPAPFTDVRVNILEAKDTAADAELVNFDTFSPVDQDFYIWFMG